MSKDYNIMANAGISDQDFVELQGLPKELAQTADLHLWMTYQIYLGNKELETPEETQRLINEHFITMRMQVPQSHWMEMDVLENQDGSNKDTQWYLNDSKLLENCRLCFEKHP
jgi:hypothetical protein